MADCIGGWPGLVQRSRWWSSVAVALVTVSGGSDADPRTPPALAGMPPPFLGTAVTGDGGVTGAIDAYGTSSTCGRRGRRAGADRQPGRSTGGGNRPVRYRDRAAGECRLRAAAGLWRADSVSQRYLPGTNVVRTVARFGGVTIRGERRGRARDAGGDPPGESAGRRVGGADLSANLIGGSGARCGQSRRPGQVAIVCSTGASALRPSLGPSRGRCRPDHSRRRRRRSRLDRSGAPLGTGAPAWARRMYDRSLLTLRALTDRRSGAVAAGARDGWAYVWPRDAATAALAFAAAGYRSEARRVARFLLGLNLGAAARFEGDGAPVPGRTAQGDAAGWVAAAAAAAGLPPHSQLPERNRPGATAPITRRARPATTSATRSPPMRPGRGISAVFGTPPGLLRRAGDPCSGPDSSAAWAVRPFPHPALFPAVRRTLLTLTAGQTRYGITPGEGWAGGVDPWSAPTAWTAWSLATLAGSERERRRALRLLAALRRAATPADTLPERVDEQTGLPESTTRSPGRTPSRSSPLRQLWPGT